jgi:predicted RNase H-like HicB family nuclease
MTLYDLEIEIEELDDGGDYRYMATSPDLPNLTVVGDTTEEVLNLVPQVAAALIASVKAAGDALPDTLRV